MQQILQAAGLMRQLPGQAPVRCRVDWHGSRRTNAEGHTAEDDRRGRLNLFCLCLLRVSLSHVFGLCLLKAYDGRDWSCQEVAAGRDLIQMRRAGRCL
jgi:hypothetical protein